MTPDAIKAAVQKQRTFKHEVQGRGFTLVLPTDHQLQVEYLRAGGKQDPSAWLVMTRRLLETSVQGWTDVHVDDIVRNGVSDDAPFDASLVPALLDAQPSWTAELSNAMTDRIAAAKEKHGQS